MTARQAALAALERCRRDGAWSSQVMDAFLQDRVSDRREAALATRLFLGVLQNTAYLDHYIYLFCTAKLERKLRDLLRLGAYQLLFLDKIPVHAAVSESVVLCKDLGMGRASGLVNAVLRRIAEQREHLPEIPGKGTAAYLSTRYSHPQWLAERLIREHGYDFTEAFFEANNRPAEITLQVNTLKTDPAHILQTLSEAGVTCGSPSWPENCLTIQNGRIHELPGFSEGLFYVQDRAAAMAVSIADPRPGFRVLDACAAPGGKSFAAAIRMQNEGRILSCDIHEKKLALVREGAERLGISILETRAHDARSQEVEWRSAFDLVIADVPCSGLGVIRKKPEIRYKKEEELHAFPEIQTAILENLTSCVRPGGTLLYATCTILREENEDVVQAFLSRHREYTLERFVINGKETEGFYTFWPQTEGTDGFFAAKMRRAEI